MYFGRRLFGLDTNVSHSRTLFSHSGHKCFARGAREKISRFFKKRCGNGQVAAKSEGAHHIQSRIIEKRHALLANEQYMHVPGTERTAVVDI